MVLEHQRGHIRGIGVLPKADDDPAHDVTHEPGRVGLFVCLRPQVAARVMRHPIANEIDLADDSDDTIVVIEDRQGRDPAFGQQLGCVSHRGRGVHSRNVPSHDLASLHGASSVVQYRGA
ncbi:MAG: hypothetical protein M3Y44_09140 [Actinomycetota bacterium]|nr:hypothetical protein [Actinomycetota bacterium]